MATHYIFEGTRYEDTNRDRRRLLEAINTKISDAILSSEQYETDDERTQAEQAVYAGTSLAGTSFAGRSFWGNLLTIISQSPCNIEVKAVQESMTQADIAAICFEYSKAVRNDFTEVDGRTVRDDLAAIGNAVQNPESTSAKTLREKLSLCLNGTGVWDFNCVCC